MRCWSSPGRLARAWAGQSGRRRSSASRDSRVAPSASSTSMRSTWPQRCRPSCSAPMSITASGGPDAATVPAMRRVCMRPPSCHGRGVCRACSGVRPRASSAGALRKTASGANRSSRPPPSNGRGMSAGATGASRSASPPSTRNCTGVAVPARAVASIQGAARLTWGCCATRPYSDSGRPPCMARSSRSGWPLTVRTARENSSSADWLITCTAKPRATPSMMATRAVAVRQGCWRSSCQEKVRSRASMGDGPWR